MILVDTTEGMLQSYTKKDAENSIFIDFLMNENSIKEGVLEGKRYI